jgi:hypothetical protein
MTATEMLRQKIKKYVDNADEKSLLVVQHILENKQDDDWWDTVPKEIKESVKRAIKEIDEGKGIPHEEIKKMYPQWFKR